MSSTAHPPVTDRIAEADAAIGALRRSMSAFRCAGSRRLVQLGISMTHFHVLLLLRHHASMPMGRLADTLGVSMPAVSGIVDRLEERGLVVRVRVPDDRRVVLVRPTPQGLELIDDAEMGPTQVLAAALGRLTPDQLDRVIGAAADLGAALEAEAAADPALAGAGSPCPTPRP